jgi:homoserine O-acetyltransferase/O-succinyltransferase
MTEQRIPDRYHTLRDFRLASGRVLPEATIAYVTYGTLAPDGLNAILLTHGFTSSHRFIDQGAPGEGAWGALVGPDRAIDTRRWFVVSSNMLGSSYGSTCPRSLDPATGKPYGPDFPTIGLVDIVTAQRALLEALGVKRLLAVVGPSYGGFQAFQWAVTFPDFMDGISPVVSDLRSPQAGGGDQGLIARFAAEANWNGGHYYERGGINGAMQALRIETLLKYGADVELSKAFPDPSERRAEIEARAGRWAEEFDANSLIALARASANYDVTNEVARIKARVLFVLSRTDQVFPPSLAPDVMNRLTSAGVAADYFEIDSPFGHQASGSDAAKWAPVLAEFLEGLAAARS